MSEEARGQKNCTLMFHLHHWIVEQFPGTPSDIVMKKKNESPFSYYKNYSQYAIVEIDSNIV